MASKPAAPPLLTGLAADLASLPQSPDLRGGVQSGFTGAYIGQPAESEGAPADGEDFTGLGPFLEAPDADVFKLLDGLVQRYEWIAKNHLAQDSHWTLVKLGYPWSTLTKIPGKDQWEQTLPYGVSGVTIQPVPNKAWDLVNKATETVLVDFPKVEASPSDDSEEAEGAADMANRFLDEDASEQGTNDAVLWNDRVSRALVTASSYLEAWVDPVGGGWVPLQIKAHPQAVSPENPLVGHDGMPTTDYVLRYVTEDRQFTENAIEAAPQWQPKIRATKWGREHVCVFPESATVDQAEKVVIKGFCTLGEGKRRWPAIEQMSETEQAALCDWTPQRYLVLLPPFQRARWKLTDSRDKDKGSAADERIFFYYHVLQRATPDYRKGADVVVTGALGMRILDKQTLSADVESQKQGQPTSETRCREIPLVQITPCGDPDEQDPTGRSFLELFAGAVENNAHLAMSASDVIDRILHLERFIGATSSVDAEALQDSRATGSYITLQRMEDKPSYAEPPVLPAGFFNFYELSDEAINSIASQERAASGAENSKERSGKALQIAIGRNNVANTGKQHAVMTAYARWSRIKLELAMTSFTTPHLIKYVGEDGAYKQQEFTGVDFALVGKVDIKTGTGTMHSDDEKVQYLGNLQVAQMIDTEEAKEAARPGFAKTLGLAANPHEQYVERCIAAWLEGPPSPEWAQQYASWKAMKDQHDQATQAFQQQQQQYDEAEQLASIVAGGPPPMLGPEGQNAQAMQQYQLANIKLQRNPYGAGLLQTLPQSPQAPVQPQPKAVEEPPVREPVQEQEPPHKAVERAFEHVAKLLPQSHPPAPQTIHVHASTGKPRKKKTRIVKNEDGSYSAETDEESEEDAA